MRRIFRLSAWLLILLLAMQLTPVASASSSTAPSRVINVVYDDSGSMITTGGQLVDTWCQAKYAMEVFAAMLGTNDTMNIYVMSDFDYGRTNSNPKLVLSGSDGQSTNVSKIHNMVTAAGNTPFNSVRKAYSDLSKATADEKWLVVLTDGEFQGVDNIDAFLAQKAEDINIMFLGMGPNASEITESPHNGIFFEKAATSDQILSKITGICTRIFNSDRLDVNVSAKTVTFDVPMGELVVFAQGENVSINSIISSSGKDFPSSTLPVTVQYSETPATNYKDFIVARNLKGSIATFKDDFAAGSYTIDVTGADTIEVYYKPNVEIAAYLTDSTGQEVTTLENLKAGEYTINFGFVKAGTTERVNQSSLLGDVSYSAIVTNNGVTHENAYSSGDKIYIEEGSLEIDATARYLEYNSVSTHLDYSIYEDKQITLSLIDNPTYVITKDGMEASSPIQIKALWDGQEITAEQWEDMVPITVSLIETESGHGYGPFTVEKSITPGIYEIYPSLSLGLMNAAVYENCDFSVTYENMHGPSTWSGAAEGTLNVNDTRSWLERNLQLLIKGLIIALIVIFILGYIPPFKKYLPKRLKKRPSIDCSPNRPGVHQMTASGRYTKRFITTLIPYKAEEGSIKFVPPGVAGVAVMQIKAAGGSAMMVTNTRAYAGKDHITFNGSPVDEGKTKPIRISAGAMISVNTREMTYTCIPNQ